MFAYVLVLLSSLLPYICFDASTPLFLLTYPPSLPPSLQTNKQTDGPQVLAQPAFRQEAQQGRQGGQGIKHEKEEWRKEEIEEEEEGWVSCNTITFSQAQIYFYGVSFCGGQAFFRAGSVLMSAPFFR